MKRWQSDGSTPKMYRQSDRDTTLARLRVGPPLKIPNSITVPSNRKRGSFYEPTARLSTIPRVSRTRTIGPPNPNNRLLNKRGKADRNVSAFKPRLARTERDIRERLVQTRTTTTGEERNRAPVVMPERITLVGPEFARRPESAH